MLCLLRRKSLLVDPRALDTPMIAVLSSWVGKKTGRPARELLKLFTVFISVAAEAVSTTRAPPPLFVLSVCHTIGCLRGLLTRESPQQRSQEDT